MYQILRKIKRKIEKFIFTLKKIFKYLFYPLKIDKKKIVFINFNGRGYGDNPKYIAESLIKRNINCKIVWLVRNKNEDMPKKIRKVKYGSIRAYYEMATAKVWISNVRNYKFAIKKKNQFYIQTWHASLGYKKVEGEIEQALDPQYVKEAKQDGKYTDLIISDNDISTYLYKNNFWYDGQVSNIGVPRNDILFSRPKEIKEKVYKYFNIPSEKKIILYEPTFRNNFNFNLIKLDFNRLLELVEEKFKNEYVLLIRLHPNVIEYAKNIEYTDNILNATMYPDNQELLSVADIGITDYSCISFELAMMNIPVFLFCKDIEEYKKGDRELNFSFEELPFDCSTKEQGLFDNIKKFSEEEYKIKCEEFFNNINLVKNTNASDEIAKIIEEKIKVCGVKHERKNIEI